MDKIKKMVKKTIKTVLAYMTITYWKLAPAGDRGQKTAFLFHVSKWKRPFIVRFLTEYKVKFVPFDYNLKYLRHEIERYDDVDFIVWGYNAGRELKQYASDKDIPLYRIEDGFVRSKGLGALHTPPYSVCLDRKGMYFDSSRPSDLEDILNQFPFKENPALLEEAEKNIRKLKELGVSKYNHVDKRSVHDIYGPKTTKRILVIGQVEDDASIKMGSSEKWTNNDLVRMARSEHKEAQIIYKPHPDVLTGRREKQSNPEDIRHLAMILESPLSLVDALETIDHVYTITSLSGFEALLRGIPVTTAGAPFYSGWGLTDDRQSVDRRKRNLSVTELFVGAYLLYPRYRDPHTGEELTLSETINRIIK
ncbi:capsular polysaccharide biosynthesis protein [Halobacillus litoralis]|uniref:capsular polysaccharide export protein, LipB/KpsS family n=1 Tax=Halobacillus litoralis TaxID=45668 RepID=UPI00136D8329|nr:capsular polysaccharide biosynthesis protein [Halobacillus litoralis]MYL36433.1 capsular polysaccharide biosynthesis protein [Halobacillus litoralis]